jgi:ubiquitin thioesterase protein OTUB1
MYSPDDELAVGTALSTIESTLPMLEAAGFQKLVYEDFYEAFVDLIRNIISPNANGRTLSDKMLLDAFQSPEGTPALRKYVSLFPKFSNSVELDRGVPPTGYLGSAPGGC